MSFDELLEIVGEILHHENLEPSELDKAWNLVDKAINKKKEND